jgi:hypothetical protein
MAVNLEEIEANEPEIWFAHQVELIDRMEPKDLNQEQRDIARVLTLYHMNDGDLGKALHYAVKTGYPRLIERVDSKLKSKLNMLHENSNLNLLSLMHREDVHTDMQVELAVKRTYSGTPVVPNGWKELFDHDKVEGEVKDD